jgi:hypothetical protein
VFDWIKLTFGMRKLVLKPNDILIVNIKNHLSAEGLTNYRKQLREVLDAKGIKNDCLVLEEGVTFSKINIK